MVSSAAAFHATTWVVDQQPQQLDFDASHALTGAGGWGASAHESAALPWCTAVTSTCCLCTNKKLHAISSEASVEQLSSRLSSCATGNCCGSSCDTVGQVLIHTLQVLKRKAYPAYMPRSQTWVGLIPTFQRALLTTWKLSNNSAGAIGSHLQQSQGVCRGSLMSGQATYLTGAT
jgi:hypothetical protein